MSPQEPFDLTLSVRVAHAAETRLETRSIKPRLVLLFQSTCTVNETLVPSCRVAGGTTEFPDWRNSGSLQSKFYNQMF